MGDKMVLDASWQDFGADLIATYDLDPIYPMVAAAVTDWNRKLRWLLAYWCFYHAGVASAIAERPAKDFYMLMHRGAVDGWPRGMERRYFWGDLALDTIRGLHDNFSSPEAAVEYMTNHKDFQSLSKAVQSCYGFGPWIAWKVGDMAERVLCHPVSFSDSTLGIYRDPVQGAAWIKFGDKRHAITEDELGEVVEMMENEFSGHLAPPYQDRPINIQEVETVLCKYKAHCFGHYPYGNDSIHVAKALDGWGDLAQHMKKTLLLYVTYINGGNHG